MPGVVHGGFLLQLLHDGGFDLIDVAGRAGGAGTEDGHCDYSAIWYRVKPRKSELIVKNIVVVRVVVMMSKSSDSELWQTVAGELELPCCATDATPDSDVDTWMFKAFLASLLLRSSFTPCLFLFCSILPKLKGSLLFFCGI